MNRRRVVAAALPVLFGGGTLRALAQDKPKPKRVRIEVSLQKPGLALGETNARIIVLTVAEGIETETAFLQMYTFKENKADNAAISQAFGPRLTVTAYLAADGRIRLKGRVEFEAATALAAPAGEPLPLASTALVLDRTVTGGQAITLGGLVVGKETQTISLTATVVG